MDGWAVPQLADFVEAVCRGGEVEAARTRLLAVGHSSGESLAAGALHVLAPSQLRGAA
jgi:predicted alpha/beta hydrolase family esterase